MVDEVVAQVQTEDVTQKKGNVLGLVAGDVASKTYLLTTVTDGAVTKPLSLDNLDEDFLETEDNKSYAITGTVVARDVATGDTGYNTMFAIYKRGVGVATLTLLQGNNYDFFSGTILVNFPTHTNFAADVVNGFMNLEVTGYAGVVVKWGATFTVTEIGNTV